MLPSAKLYSSYTYNDYRTFYTHSEMEDVQQLAKRLLGTRVVHVNATDTGGGVAEILHGLVPFEQSLHIKSSWRVLTAGKPFFSITKKIHNALQGAGAVLGRSGISDEEWQLYAEESKDISYALAALQADIIVIHDPQPMLAGSLAETTAYKIARIHIDMSSPDQHMLNRLLPYMQSYKQLVFSVRAYVPKGVNEDHVALILPSIDPLSEKNKPLGREDARRMLAKFGVIKGQPLMVQVSRFDPWKDPVGVIQAYHIAREKIPGLQLILMGSTQVEDDPEAAGILQEIRTYAEKDSGIIVISEHSNSLVNAVQTSADIVVQKSLREGFGLTVTEAMWKSRAVVAGNVGGIRQQIIDGENGYLVNSVKEAAERIIELLQNESLRKEMGEQAHEIARERFLLPREVHDHLQLYANVLGL